MHWYWYLAVSLSVSSDTNKSTSHSWSKGEGANTLHWSCKVVDPNMGYIYIILYYIVTHDQTCKCSRPLWHLATHVEWEKIPETWLPSPEAMNLLQLLREKAWNKPAILSNCGQYSSCWSFMRNGFGPRSVLDFFSGSNVFDSQCNMPNQAF